MIGSALRNVVLATLAVGLILVLAACEKVELPQTEADAISYVKGRLHPYKYDPEFSGVSPAEHNRLVESCRSFLNYAHWTAYQVPYEKLWSVSGTVWSSPPRRLLNDLNALAEYQKGIEENTWLINEHGKVISVGLSSCDHK